jgi:hypothetical protein
MIGSRNMMTMQAAMTCQDEKMFSRSPESIAPLYLARGGVAS